MGVFRRLIIHALGVAGVTAGPRLSSAWDWPCHLTLVRGEAPLGKGALLKRLLRALAVAVVPLILAVGTRGCGPASRTLAAGAPPMRGPMGRLRANIPVVAKFAPGAFP